MGRIAIRNNSGVLDRPAYRKKNEFSIKGLRINSYKLRTSLSGVTIIYNQTNPELEPVYGQNDLHMQLYLSWSTLRDLRRALSYDEQNTNFKKAGMVAWLQTYLRSASNLDVILAEIRKHKWPYVLSATTLF